ncbi:MAG: lytic transglycosylase domain-containing protein [Deltaproteobacteria bacterium]|nr:lytic transglycosylase domain-containing protein [Deltaproteobacteria bacterium]
MTVVALCVFTAYGLALVEHQARLTLAAVKAFSKMQPSVELKLAQPPFVSELSPNLLILGKIKKKTSKKPIFDEKSNNYDSIIEKVARQHQVSPALVKAVIQAESRFNQGLISSQGAVGLMQVLPSTARSMGVSAPYEPIQNITAGVRFLKILLIEFGDDEHLALAAYNCGPEAIKRYGYSVPPFNQTKRFVNQVMRYYQSYIDS